MPMQLLVLKCSEKPVWPLRHLNCVLASTAGVGLKATDKGERRTRGASILEQLLRVCFFVARAEGE